LLTDCVLGRRKGFIGAWVVFCLLMNCYTFVKKTLYLIDNIHYLLHEKKKDCLLFTTFLFFAQKVLILFNFLLFILFFKIPVYFIWVWIRCDFIFNWLHCL